MIIQIEIISDKKAIKKSSRERLFEKKRIPLIFYQNFNILK